MLSFKELMNEVAEPKAGDEQRFKAKHIVQVIDEPHMDKETREGTKKSPAKKKRLADLEKGEDEAVYEQHMMTCEDCGEEYDEDEGEHECEMEEETMSDAEMKKREDIVKGMKKNEKDLKKRYGDRWKAVMYATATKKAMEEGIAKHIVRGDNYAGVPDRVVAAAKEQVKKMRNISTASDHDKAMQKALSDHGWEMTISGKYVKEEVELGEAFKVGPMKLKDGSTVKLTNEDVQALDNLYKNLNASNRNKMQEKLEANKKSFGEILAFAKQAM